LRGRGPRPAAQSGDAPRALAAAAFSSKTSLIAVSPAATMASIIGRRLCATSGSAGSSHRKDRLTLVCPAPASLSRVVMCIVVGWSAMRVSSCPGSRETTCMLTRTASVVAVELAPQILSARAGDGVDAVGEEITLHHRRNQHQLVDQFTRSIDAYIGVDHRLLGEDSLPFRGLRRLPQIGDLFVAARDSAKVEFLSVWRESRTHVSRQSLQHRVGDEQIFLGWNFVLEKPVGHDDVGSVELLHAAESLPGKLAVVDDELQLEDPDICARA